MNNGSRGCTDQDNGRFNGGVYRRKRNMSEATGANKVTLELGQLTKDGVYAGLTADGKQQIYAMPTDLRTRFLKRSLTMTFSDASKVVEKLNEKNALGHNDWEIPNLANLHILQKNQNEGNLKGT